MSFVVLLHAAPSWWDGTALHSCEVEFVDRCHVSKDWLYGDIVLWHDKRNLTRRIVEGDGRRERVEYGVDDTQLCQREAFVGLHAESDSVAFGSLGHVGSYHSVLGITNGDQIFLDGSSRRFVNNLVDIGRQRA